MRLNSSSADNERMRIMQIMAKYFLLCVLINEPDTDNCSLPRLITYKFGLLHIRRAQRSSFIPHLKRTVFINMYQWTISIAAIAFECWTCGNKFNSLTNCPYICVNVYFHVPSTIIQIAINIFGRRNLAHRPLNRQNPTVSDWSCIWQLSIDWYCFVNTKCIKLKLPGHLIGIHLIILIWRKMFQC